MYYLFSPTSSKQVYLFSLTGKLFLHRSYHCTFRGLEVRSRKEYVIDFRCMGLVFVGGNGNRIGMGFERRLEELWMVREYIVLAFKCRRCY